MGCTAKKPTSGATASSLSVDDLITLSGVAEGAADLGTFTGSTITDNRTNKQALQECETAIETKVGKTGNETIAGNKTFSGNFGCNGKAAKAPLTMVDDVEESDGPMGATVTANATAINEIIDILKEFGFMAES